MKILYSSDTHVHPGHLDRFLKAAGELGPQLLIVGGDIIPDWKGSIAASIEPHKLWVRDVLLPRLKEFRPPAHETRVLIDLGNDDIAAARPLMEASDGIDLDLLHMRVIKVNENLAVVGYMAVNPTPFLIKDHEKPDCRDHDGLSEGNVSEERLRYPFGRCRSSCFGFTGRRHGGRSGRTLLDHGKLQLGQFLLYLRVPCSPEGHRP